MDDLNGIYNLSADFYSVSALFMNIVCLLKISWYGQLIMFAAECIYTAQPLFSDFVHSASALTVT